jgi:Peptidase family M23
MRISSVWRAAAQSAILFLTVTTASAADTPPHLRLPLDCRLGETCWVMNYMDTDPSPAARDFRCNGHSYDGHSGTDFAIRDRKAMAQGVAVFATAAGTVIQARDGEEDGLWVAGAATQIKAAHRECGNRVAIDHGNGWFTDSCHMQRGSIRVKVGDHVAAGQQIGAVGQSGMTEYPHVHLGVIHRTPTLPNGESVDPFTGQPATAGCGLKSQPLWAEPVPYLHSSLFAAGFADHPPSGAEIREDAASAPRLSAAKSNIVLWGAIFVIDKGADIAMRLSGPDGQVLAQTHAVADHDGALQVPALVKHAPPQGWPPGTYRGEVTVTPPGDAALSRTVAVEVR